MTLQNKRDVLSCLPESWRPWERGQTEEELIGHCPGRARTIRATLAYLVERGQVERVERAGVARYFHVREGRDAAVGKVKAALGELPPGEPIDRASLRKLIADVYTPIVRDEDFEHAVWTAAHQGYTPRVEAK